MRNRWLVMYIGCLECGSKSSVIGTYETLEEAEGIADKITSGESEAHSLGCGDDVQVFDLDAKMDKM